MWLLSPETFVSLVYVAVGGLLILFGLPLYLHWIPPNRFYGFRTRRTIADANLWYLVNRVTGGWLTITGAMTAGIATATERFGLALPTAATINCAVVIAGMIVTIAGSLRTLWRAQ